MDQTRTSSLEAARPLPPSADIGPGGQSVGQATQFCLDDNLGGLRVVAKKQGDSIVVLSAARPEEFQNGH
jgi:hypothetical protein